MRLINVQINQPEFGLNRIVKIDGYNNKKMIQGSEKSKTAYMNSFPLLWDINWLWSFCECKKSCSYLVHASFMYNSLYIKKLIQIK